MFNIYDKSKTKKVMRFWRREQFAISHNYRIIYRGKRIRGKKKKTWRFFSFFPSFAKDRFKIRTFNLLSVLQERQVTAIFKEHWPTGNQITFHSYENFNFYLVRLDDESRWFTYRTRGFHYLILVRRLNRREIERERKGKKTENIETREKYEKSYIENHSISPLSIHEIYLWRTIIDK